MEGGRNTILELEEEEEEEEENCWNLMDRGFSQDLCRNTTEEIFLKSLMDTTTPTSMEMLGFRNLSQNHNFRVDSEELFNTWLTHGEDTNGYNSTNIAQRTRQASRRLSTELAALNTHQHQHGPAFHNKTSKEVLPMVDELSSQHNQQSPSLRRTMEKGMQATNLYIAKTWFHSSQPMTRSRSSELRRRYAANQALQTSIGMEATRDASMQDTNRMKQGTATTTLVENPKQLETFMSPSNSSTSPFSTPIDAVSSVVSMLKGTLERKKLSNHMDTETVEGSWFELYGSQEAPLDMSFHQGPANLNFEPSGNFQVLSPLQAKDSQTLKVVNDPIEIDIRTTGNPMQTISYEPSQSESSVAAPVLSTGIIEVCDGPSNSAQTPSVSKTSRKQLVNESLECSSKAKEFKERILENNLKDDRKKGILLRMGSVTSGGSVDKGDPTKKRRVERSRKMAEAKERFMTPAVSLDMQTTLKRCENLEKEVRSLKLNLSFMNRKDSEQTKQIEDLRKKNEELVDEKERLLEEIERILSETANM